MRVPTGAGILILGAASPVARELAHQLASRGCRLVLAGRDLEDLGASARDLAIRFEIPASVLPFDATAFPTHGRMVQDAVEALEGELDGVIVLVGYLGDQRRAEHDPVEAARIVETNFTGCVSVLNAVSVEMERRGRGFICVLGSVAGDRGRQSNYLYGAAKGGLAIYLQGLRNRLFRSGVAVTTVKPGFMDTRMTFGRAGAIPAASPEVAAKKILRAVDRQKDVVYVPGFWRTIMLVIRLIPERIFKRLQL